MLHRSLLPFLLLCVLLPLAAQAVTVDSQGQALIGMGGKDQAREQAIREASQLALLQAGSSFSSSQEMENGVMQRDTTRMSSEGRITDIKVLKEKTDNGVLIVWIRAEIEPEQSCAQPGITRNYRKNILIAAFPMLRPDDATLGGIGNIVNDLSIDLAHRLGGAPGLALLPMGKMQVLGAQQAPATGDLPNISLALPQLRHMSNVQYVVSGRIRDLSMAPIDNATSGSWLSPSNLKDYVPGLVTEHRQFAMDIYVHDADDGQLIFQDSIQTSGAWIPDRYRQIGFGTETFWKSLYGQAVNRSLDGLAHKLTGLLQCQPFSARIIRPEGQRLLVNAGRQAGLRVGDTLQVYRQRYDYGSQGEVYPQLDDTQTSARVSSIQGDSAWLELPFDASQINIQQDDRVMAW